MFKHKHNKLTNGTDVLLPPFCRSVSFDVFYFILAGS